MTPVDVFADAPPPQIELSVSQASPGATIEVMGGRFPEDALVKLALRRAEAQISLGTMLADDHGEFSVAVLLPSDLQYGEYELQVIDETNQLATAPISIIADTSMLEGSGQREDSDGLLAPMPTLAPGANPGGIVQTTPRPASGQSSVWYITLGLFVVAIFVFLGIRAARKR